MISLSQNVPKNMVRTPYVRISIERIGQNIINAQQFCDSIGAKLRPNYKTHRTMQIAGMQVAQGAVGFTCATLEQARELLNAGYKDIFVACAFVPDESNIDLAAEMVASDAVTFAVPNAAIADRFADIAQLTRTKPRVMLELDSGGARTGCRLDEILNLAQSAEAAGLGVDGIFSYPADAYAPGSVAQSADAESAVLMSARGMLSDGGYSSIRVSAGSTPTLRFASCGEADEYRPGTYVFGDRQQQALGSAGDETALSVVATVVEVSRDRFVLDAGGKLLGRDTREWLDGFGVVENRSIVRLYDHHSVLAGPTRFTVGERVNITPNNCNTVVNNARVLWCEDDVGNTEPFQVGM